jgi:DNA gyrase inhibitor GyrI
MKSEVSSMNEFDVRIVKLEPMRVASALGFGFNNPDPSPGNPNYGYELWLTVTPDVVPAGDIKIKDVLGGLYAVSRFQDLANIGRMWQRLVAWREESNYKAAHHQWLEELLTPAERPPEEYVFDIYLPIRE